MAEITIKGNQPIPQNRGRRKSHVGLIVFIIILVIFLVLPLALVGILFLLITDPSHKATNAKAGVTNEQVFESLVYDSFDYTKEEHKIRIRLTEDNLNQLLYNSLDGFSTANGMIRNFYVSITDTHYKFVMEFNVQNIIKTRLIISSRLNVDETNITFRIGDITIGNIHGLEKSVTQILSMANVDIATELDKAFVEAGLNIHMDMKKLEMVYPLDNFYNDIVSKITSGSISGGTYGSVIGEMVSNRDIQSILPNSNHALELAIDLEKLRTNSTIYGIENYSVPSGYLSTYTEAAKATTVSYLNSNAISKENAPAVFKYYVVGFDHLETDEKEIITTYRDSNTIAEATNTYDFSVPEEEQLKNVAKAQIDAQANLTPPYYPQPDNINIDITTAQVDKMLSQSNIIGSSTVLVNQDDSGYKLSYFVISRVTTTVHNNELFFTISIDINGYETNIALKTNKIATNEFAEAKFQVSNMYLGNYQVGDGTKQIFIDLIKNSLQNGAFNGAAKLEVVDNEIFVTVSLKEVFTNDYALIYAILVAGYDTDCVLTSNTASNTGQLRFSVTKKA